MLLHIHYWEYGSTVGLLISRDHNILIFGEENERPSHSLVLCFIIQSTVPCITQLSPYRQQFLCGNGGYHHFSCPQAHSWYDSWDIILQHKPVNFSTESRTTQTVNHTLKECTRPWWSQTASSTTCYEFIMGYKNIWP